MTEQEKQKLKDALIETKHIHPTEYDDEDAFVGICFSDLERYAHTGWHPASELPVIPEGKFSVRVIAYCHTPSGIYVPVEIAYTITGGWQYESVKWWCYPPKED